MTPNIILITGATAGIGRHAALTLARRGHTVIATGRREEALASLQAESAGLHLTTLRLDVTDAQSVAQAVASVHTLTAGHGLDVLINNAGYGQLGAVLDVDDGQVRAQYETNVFGVLNTVRAFAPAMIRRGSGRILNVSSIGGLFTLPLFGVYNSTKYAVESLSDALRRELRPCGVDVVIIEPGTINTNFSSTAKASVDRSGSAWFDVYTTAESNYAWAERMAPDPTPISRVMTRAIESRRPRARYTTPWRDKLAIQVMNLLPTRLADAIASAFFGLGKVHPQRVAPVLLAEVA
ncbi:MAG: short-subunit dehydrogenase [Myxococcota bacterium]|jgi:short-subunit dehydrogenase